MLRCKNVVITGGGSGIGLAIARRLLADGVQVTIAGRNPEKLNRALAVLSHAHAHAMVWDVTQCDEIPAQLEQAAAIMGGLDGIVNNAGVGPHAMLGRGYEPWDIAPGEWDALMAVNLKGAFFVMRDGINYMKERGIRGNILNIASNAACMGIQGAYGSSKLSLMRMTRTFGQQYGEYGIIINGIAPGATATDMIAHYAGDGSAPYPRHAIGRFIRPEEIAELAAYLMGPFGEIICGHTVVADGGDCNAD